jgi:aerobic carbon-monoxide dehydrogenase medium subunit
VTLDADRAVSAARTAFLTMGPVPAAIDVSAAARAQGLRLPAAVEPAAWRSVAAEATAGLEPDDDLHATAGYRAELARVLSARALAAAAARAGSDPASPPGSDVGSEPSEESEEGVR